MIQYIFKYITLVALINMSLCVPQFDLVLANCVESTSNTIQTNEEAVASIASLICEGFFDVDSSFPIHEDAHFLEKDFVVKRVVKSISIVIHNYTKVISLVNLPVKVMYGFGSDIIVLSKQIGFLALLHYF